MSCYGKVSGSIPLVCVLMRLNPRLRSVCECMNYYKSLWTKVSAKCKKVRIIRNMETCSVYSAHLAKSNQSVLIMFSYCFREAFSDLKDILEAAS